MKIKMDMSKKKRARDEDDDRVESKSHHRKRKNTFKNKPCDHLRDENNKDEIISSTSSFKINAGEGCSKNIDPTHEQEEKMNKEEAEKSVFDFPWSKESDGGIVNIFDDGNYFSELGLDTVTFPSCNSYSYKNIIDSNLACETASSSTDVHSLDFLPQQDNSDIVDVKIGCNEPLISSTFKVDELEGSEWINNLEQTNSATSTTSATVAN